MVAVLVISIIIVFFVIILAVLITNKAYAYKHTVDPLHPPSKRSHLQKKNTDK